MSKRDASSPFRDSLMFRDLNMGVMGRCARDLPQSLEKDPNNSPKLPHTFKKGHVPVKKEGETILPNRFTLTYQSAQSAVAPVATRIIAYCDSYRR